jgi:integrase
MNEVSNPEKIEFPKGSGITIRTIPNRTCGKNYGASHIVTVPGKVTGKGRDRRQFTTLQSAKEYARQACQGVSAMGGKFLDLEHEDRQQALSLLSAIKERGGEAADVVADVQSALKALSGSALTLSQCVQFALPRLAPAKAVTVAEAVTEYLRTLENQVSGEHRRTTGVYLSRLTAKFGTLPISHLDGVKINELLGGLRRRDRKTKAGKVIPGGAVSNKFRRHVLGATRAVVRFAIGRGWLAKGVVDFEVVQAPRKDRGGKIEIYSAHELAALLKTANETDAELVPFLVLGAFSGLRTAEIERIDWGDIKLEQGHVVVGADKAKTASNRLAHLPPNAGLWLGSSAKRAGRVFVLDTTGSVFTGRVHALAKRAGLGRWRKNALRHSYISHRIAVVQDVNKVALEAGNSPAIIFRNYRALVTQAEAVNYFAIVPPPTASNVLSLVSATV